MLLSPRRDPAVTTTTRAPPPALSTSSPHSLRMTRRPATSSRTCRLPRAPPAALWSWRAGARHDPQVRSGVQVLARGRSTRGRGRPLTAAKATKAPAALLPAPLASRGAAPCRSLGGGVSERRAERPLLTPPRGHRLRDTRASDQLTPLLPALPLPLGPSAP